jgi:hypothetical protein
MNFDFSCGSVYWVRGKRVFYLGIVSKGVFMQKSILLAVAFTTLSAASWAQPQSLDSPSSSSSTTTSGVSTTGSAAYGGDNTGSNDPFIRKRAADRAARAEYKADKSAAKEKYKEQKQEARTERKEAINPSSASGSSD